MIRRVGPLLSLLALLLVVTACSLPGGSKASKEPSYLPPPNLPTTADPAVAKPNVLVIEADDMRADELVFMPNVRKLIGDRGLTFENSFAPYPLCCPSRASFLTGKYAHNHHVLSHSDPFGFKVFDDRVTLATQLQGAGYLTGLTGKYLNGYGRQHIFGKPLEDISDKYVPPGWTDWMAGSDHGYRPDSKYFGSTYNYFHMTQVINGTITAHPGVYSTDLTAGQARGMVTKYGKEKKPWFVWWTPVAPHFGGPREKDDPNKIRDGKGHKVGFATPARPSWVKGRFDKAITHPLGTPKSGPVEADISDKPHLLKKFPEPNKPELAAMTNLTRQRAEAIYALDRQIGRTLQTLKKTGQYDNTIIAFTSDNGYFLGEHRRPQGKILVHEPSLRVPLLIAGPGIPQGKRYDPVTTIDMAPTIATYAGLPGMPDQDGVPLQKVIQDGDQGWTVPVVTEGLVGNKQYYGNFSQPEFDSLLNVRGIRMAQWKYTKYSTGERELYDLSTDPLELNSLQADPAYATVMARMDKIWTKYYRCAGAACQAPLPKDLQATPAEEKQITDNETAKTDAYYSVPGNQK